jgi:hypothetical protein
MTLEEVLGNFVSFEFMIKGSRKINELDGPSTSEAQPVAFKATEERSRAGRSGLPGILGRVFRVFYISGFKHLNPNLYP